MEQTVLTPVQRTALDCIAQKEDITAEFYLTGGTALAEYYLHHRYSEDLDFFTSDKEFPQIAIEHLAQEIQKAIHAEKVEYRRLHDRRIFFFSVPDAQELKMEFTHYPFDLLNPYEEKNGIHIDSLTDIAANKLMALMDRMEPKDFVDLYFLLKERNLSLDSVTEFVKKKFHLTLDPLVLGSELAKVKNITMLPRMIKPLTLEELKSFFSLRAEELKPRIFE